MAYAEATLPGMLKLLADPTRLRMLSLLALEELSVGELCRTLGLAQSRVSNHLRILREADLLRERHVGTSTHLRLATPQNGHAPLGRLWEALRDEFDALPEHAADRARLDAILAERRARDGDFFDRVAGEWDKIAGAFSTGRARLHAALHLLPADFVVADLGCGTGYMAEALLGHCSRVICIDRSEAMLEEARKRSAGRGSAEVEVRRGDLDALPLEDAEVDGVVAGMVLHHLEEPFGAVHEMMRVLKPGGSAAVMELSPHKEAWMRQELGDRHLGLEPQDVLTAFRRAGFEETVIDSVDDRYQPHTASGDAVSLALYIVRGRKPRA